MGQQEYGPEPIAPLCLLCIVGAGLAAPWFMGSNVGPVELYVAQQLRIGIMLLPIMLLIALRFLSPPSPPPFLSATSASASFSSDYSAPSYNYGGHSSSSSDDDSSAPWCVLFFLFLVLSMIWYHSGILRSWHPIVRI